jgi:uncharacterized membrane protein YjjP (DUF1212 family)
MLAGGLNENLDPQELREGIAFAKKLGRALHRHGAPAYRLEAVLDTLSRLLGLRGDFFTTPSALFYAFDLPGEGGRAYLQRVRGTQVHFARLIALDRVFNDAVLRRTSLQEADANLDRALASPSPWPPWVVALAFVAISCAAALFYRGGPAELALAAAAGAALALVHLAARPSEAMARLFEPLGAFAVAFTATALAPRWGASADIATLAGLVVLVPGFSITVAATELATGHPVSGSGRLANALMTLLMLGFGAGFGRALAADAFGGTEAAVAVAPLPAWAEPAALTLAGLALGVFFQARPRDLPVVVAAVFVPWFVLRAASDRAGLEGALFLAAFANGIAAHAWARWRDLPSMIVRLPGMLILVPGGTGFLSISALMDGDALSGVQILFRVGISAIAIVTGILLATVVLPPRKAL